MGTFDVNDTKRPEPIEIADGQVVEKIVLALSKGGVIVGQVLDEAGDPLPGAEVRALRSRFVDGQRRLMPYYAAGGNAQVVTDDRITRRPRQIIRTSRWSTTRFRSAACAGSA